MKEWSFILWAQLLACGGLRSLGRAKASWLGDGVPACEAMYLEMNE